MEWVLAALFLGALPAWAIVVVIRTELRLRRHRRRLRGKFPEMFEDDE